MTARGNKLRVIKILDPVLCMACNFAYIAEVEMSDGKDKKMFYCSRLDCDNWQLDRSSTFQEVAVENLPRLP